MFCKMCGTEAGANDHFCVKCGRQLVTGTETPRKSNLNPTTQPQPERHDRLPDIQIAAKRDTPLTCLTTIIIVLGLVMFISALISRSWIPILFFFLTGASFSYMVLGLIHPASFNNIFIKYADVVNKAKFSTIRPLMWISELSGTVTRKKLFMLFGSFTFIFFIFFVSAVVMEPQAEPATGKTPFVVPTEPERTDAPEPDEVNEKFTEESYVDTGIDTNTYSNTNQTEVHKIEYTVVAREDISYAGTPRMVNRIIIEQDQLPSELELRSMAEEIFTSQERSWAEFTIFSYMRGMNTDGLAYAIAEYENNSLVDFKINSYALIGTKWYISDITTGGIEEGLIGENQETNVTVYFINLTVTKTGTRNINISVDTNFPDNTNFLVTVKRIYFQKDRSEEYAGEIFSEDISVTNGSIDQNLNVDDSGWHSEFQDNFERFRGLDVFGEIERIMPEIEVRVLWSPRRDQPNHILEILGSNGEYVSGEGADKFGSFTTFNVTESLDMPFNG